MTPPPPTLTIQESHALLDALLGNGGTEKQYAKRLRNYTMAMVMLEAGLRVGELVKLRWSDLFFNCLPVTSIIISPEISKSKRERQIPVSTRLSDALSTYHVTFDPIRNVTDGPAFWSGIAHHKPLTTRQVERIIASASQNSIGRSIHPHVLRHTFASKLMRVAPAPIVQQILGHSHLSSTQIYCHPNNEDLKAAIANLNKEVTGLGQDLENLASYPPIPQNLDTTNTDRNVR